MEDGPFFIHLSEHVLHMWYFCINSQLNIYYCKAKINHMFKGHIVIIENFEKQQLIYARWFFLIMAYCMD